MTGEPVPPVELYLHVRVLISMILGLSVTRLISGVAAFIQRPDRESYWFTHLCWVAWALVNVATFWWWEFRLSLVTHWNFALYAFILIYASMYYLLAVLLLPTDLTGYADYRDYFLSRRGWFFGLMALTEALDVVDTRIKGSDHMASLGPEYLVRIAGFIVLCGVASATRNALFHRLFAVGGLLYEISFFSRYYGEIT